MKIKVSKKIIINVCITCVMILLSACTNDNNEIIKKETKKVITSNSTKNQISSQNDLLYREQEYDIGAFYQAGAVEIDTSLISQDITTGEAIVVVYNDELFKEVPISDEYDELIQIKLDDAGYYGFFIKEQQGEIHDISHAVNQCSSSESSLLWLEEDDEKK